MRDEFGFDHIQSVEFCVSVTTGRDAHVNYLIPVDQTVQDALKQAGRGLETRPRLADAPTASARAGREGLWAVVLSGAAA